MSSTKRKPFSLRPDHGTLSVLQEQARLSGTPKTVLAEQYLREGVLMAEHPGIHFADGPMGRRPVVTACGIDVWEIVEVVKSNGNSATRAAEYLEIAEGQVRTAVIYYAANTQEIDDWTDRVRAFNEREEAKWRSAQRMLA